MEEYIHRENLALFKRCLAEPCTDAQREVLSALLVDELAKSAPPPTEGCALKPGPSRLGDSHHAAAPRG
jgi:hypothetical protein